MTQVSGSSGVNPIYNTQTVNSAQPVVYNPQVQGYSSDQFQTTQMQPKSSGFLGLGGTNKPYVTKSTVVMAAGLAIGGFMIGGPIGGIIGGIIGLLVGIFKNMSAMKKQQQAQGPQGQVIPAQGYNQQMIQQQQQMSLQQQQQVQNQTKSSWF